MQVMEHVKEHIEQHYAEREAERPLLELLTGVKLETIDGGYRVKETETHYIDVLQML